MKKLFGQFKYKSCNGQKLPVGSPASFGGKDSYVICGYDHDFAYIVCVIGVEKGEQLRVPKEDLSKSSFDLAFVR